VWCLKVKRVFKLIREYNSIQEAIDTNSKISAHKANNSTIIQEIILFGTKVNINQSYKTRQNMQHRQTYHLFDDVYIPYSQHEYSTSNYKLKVSDPVTGPVLPRGWEDRCTRRGWVVSSTLRPHFTSGKDPVPILQEAGWAPGPVWKGGNSRPHRDSIPDRPARSQSLYRLSYRAHTSTHKQRLNTVILYENQYTHQLPTTDTCCHNRSTNFSWTITSIDLMLRRYGKIKPWHQWTIHKHS